MSETYAESDEAARERAALLLASGPLGALVVSTVDPTLTVAGFLLGVAAASYLLHRNHGVEDGGRS